MNAADAMTSPVITVSPTTPVAQVARLLRERRIGGVPVVDQEGVIGMVSDAELLRLHGPGGGTEAPPWWQRLMHLGASQPMCAADVMTPGAVSVGEYTPLTEVAAALVQHQAHRVTVLSGRTLVGIVTDSDVMRAMLTLTHLSSEDLRTDAAIEASLGARLEAHDWWNPLASHMSVDRGIVWFRGTVETEAARDAARRAAQSTPGVCGVLDDRICAAPCEPWSSAQALEYVNG